jgi:hypothetical protein
MDTLHPDIGGSRQKALDGVGGTMPQTAKQLSLSNVRREVIVSAGFVAGMKAAMRRIVDASGRKPGTWSWRP